jgi:hypothetical protein
MPLPWHNNTICVSNVIWQNQAILFLCMTSLPCIQAGGVSLISNTEDNNVSASHLSISVWRSHYHLPPSNAFLSKFLAKWNHSFHGTHTCNTIHTLHMPHGAYQTLPAWEKMTRGLGRRCQWARDWSHRIVRVSYPYSPAQSSFWIGL